MAPPPLQENVLPEAPVTGPPEHIEKIDPYPPVPSFLAGSGAATLCLFRWIEKKSADIRSQGGSK